MRGLRLGHNAMPIPEREVARSKQKNTRRYYQAESCGYISQNTCPDYLRKAESRIKEEKARVESYLNESTLPRVQQVMDNEWILSHYKALIHMENSGCAAACARASARSGKTCA